jgi:hypothetical protein
VFSPGAPGPAESIAPAEFPEPVSGELGGSVGPLAVAEVAVAVVEAEEGPEGRALGPRALTPESGLAIKPVFHRAAPPIPK